MEKAKEPKPKANAYFRPYATLVLVIILLGFFGLTRKTFENDKAQLAESYYKIHRLQNRLQITYGSDFWKKNPDASSREFGEYLADLKTEAYDPLLAEFQKRMSQARSKAGTTASHKFMYVPENGPAQPGLVLSFLYHADKATFLFIIILVWVIGMSLEATSGHVLVPIVFLLGGIISNIVVGLFAHAVGGANGAVWALGGALAVLRPWIPWKWKLSVPGSLWLGVWLILDLIIGPWSGATGAVGGLVAGLAGAGIGVGISLGMKKRLPAPPAIDHASKTAKPSLEGGEASARSRDTIDKEALAQGAQKEAIPDEKLKIKLKEYIENNVLEEALELVDRLIARQSDDIEIMETKIQILQKLGRREASSMVKMDIITRLLKRSGDFAAEEKALAMYQSLGDEEIAPATPQDAFTLVKVLARAELFSEAVLAGNALVRSWPQDDLTPQTLSFLAKIHMDKLGDEQSAAQVYRILVEHYPQTSDADFAQRELQRLTSQ